MTGAQHQRRVSMSAVETGQAVRDVILRSKAPYKGTLHSFGTLKPPANSAWRWRASMTGLVTCF